MTDPRDPHLLAALRHAPDRDATPPPELTARILAAARAAARPPKLEAGAMQRWWAWFTRPQMGAAFATLAVATLVGVMWSSQDLPAPESAPPQEPVVQSGDEAAKREMARSGAPDAVAEAIAASSVAPLPPRAAIRPATAERREAQVQKAAEPSPRPAVRAAPRDSAALPPRAEAPATAAPPPAAAMEPPGRVAADASAEAATAPAAARPAPTPAPEPTLAPRAAVAAQGTTAPVAPGAPAAAAAPTAPVLRQRSELAAAPSLRADKSAALPDPLAALGVGGDRWTWTATGVGDRVHGPAQRELWAAMRAATAGRWSAVAPIQPFSPWLLLTVGEHTSTLWLMNDELHVTDAAGRTWRAPITPDQSRDWQAAVARW
jgi:hypothetical protein